ncbi:DUF1311 domain-containing protein [Synechococcus sp. RSCCF101]|uniref:lysozyme inhibitor LprI family protein n=1 Tax=Synechococcus sp. RSCCF101 TaxID=2511069 RepID=UPI0012455A01|nr:lysozyme inhibitor LprI family protein [Synechococcus sp. RSCCF101]QEY32708.1 DUF1311 domain-containing protein [Synechococcus sp. RSCCF101]
MRILLALAVFWLPALPVQAQEGTEMTCLEAATTQLEMNQCAGLDLEAAESELNRVLADINLRYADKADFLNKLKMSQSAWQTLREANLDLRFPLEDKRVQYGSMVPMCVQTIDRQLVIERVAFLKQWLVGIDEGDVCGGSIQSSDCLENDCS